MITQILIVLYVILLITPLLKRNKDFFSPPVLFAITMSFYTLPDIFDIFLNGEAKFVVGLRFRLEDPTYSIQRFLFLQILFVFFYYASFTINNRKTRIIKKQRCFDANVEKANLFVGLVGLIICAFTTYSFISSMGGYQEILLLYTNRDELDKNMTFLQSNLNIIITMSSAFLIKYMTQNDKKHFLLLIFLLIIGFFSNTMGGGRSKFVVFILSILCYYNYWKSRINLFDKKFFLLYGLLAMFIIAFQLLRFGGPEDMSLEYMFDNSDALFDSMAYAKTQILIQSYFDNHSLWLGRSYSHLMYIFVPSSIFPDKPHMDEGVYIYNMIFNTPDVLANNNYISSWPPFTAGITYANWGILGLIAGAIVLGIVHSYVYRKIKEYNYSIFILIIYVYIVLKFQMTVFYFCHVTYLLIETFLMYLVYKVIAGNNYFRKKKYNEFKTKIIPN